MPSSTGYGVVDERGTIALDNPVDNSPGARLFGEKLGRNDRCHCGSGKKYKKCCLDADRETDQVIREALPTVLQRNEEFISKQKRLRDDLGVHINYVAPVTWQGRQVWAIGSRVYLDRPPNETFHEFLIHVLRTTLGEQWREGQAALPEHERHIVLRCSDEFEQWKAQNADPEALARDGVQSAQPSGWAQYLLSLAWDMATVIHASNLPESLVGRLRDPQAFQGARYEVAVAAVFARLDCEIRFLDDDEELRTQKHVEFLATHRPTGQEIAVEAKSRHRRGVLNFPGEQPEDIFSGDPRAIRTLFVKALEKAPSEIPYLIFIDVNAPIERSDSGPTTPWQDGIQRWMNRLPAPTQEAPSDYTALYVTNFAPHYQGSDLAYGSEWLAVRPVYVRHALSVELSSSIETALTAYHRVPSFDPDGELG